MNFNRAVGKSKTAHDAICAARRRYHSLSRLKRPSVTDPQSCCGLFTKEELALLAREGNWPLPPWDVLHIIQPETPREAKRRRWRKCVESVCRKLLAKELPEAVALLLKEVGHG